MKPEVSDSLQVKIVRGHTEYFEFNSGCSSVQSESLGRSYTNLKIRMDIQLLN